ncbi:MAG: hypothetical protein VXW32_15415 [Myxococcota bacterium]|nr:hypothetical protein [Myxococcota bacterium]
MFKKTSFALLTSLLVLFVVECGLRTSLGPTPPPVKVYAGLEKLEEHFELRDGTVHALYDQGIPIRPFPAHWAARRIAFVGGSSVHGGSGELSEEQEFPAHAQRLSRIRSVNLGQPGLDSHDLVDIVEEVTQWSFDGLVLYTGHNDFGNAYFLERFSGVSGGLLAQATAFLERFQIYVQTRRSLRGWRGRDGQAFGGEHLVPHPLLTPAQEATTLRYLLNNIRRIHWICQQADLPLLMILPAHDPSRAPALEGVPLFAPLSAVEALRDLAAELDIPTVDAQAQLPSRNHFEDVVHLSAVGHRSLGKAVAPELKKLIQSN